MQKIAMLRLGDMSVQDYYAELQKGMIRASVHEETEDKICHFYRLFQLAMLAEKNCMGANRRK
jgi:hypothetical protein